MLLRLARQIPASDRYVDKNLRPLDAEHYSAAGLVPPFAQHVLGDPEQGLCLSG